MGEHRKPLLSHSRHRLANATCITHRVGSVFPGGLDAVPEEVDISGVRYLEAGAKDAKRRAEQSRRSILLETNRMTTLEAVTVRVSSRSRRLL